MLGAKARRATSSANEEEVGAMLSRCELVCSSSSSKPGFYRPLFDALANNTSVRECEGPTYVFPKADIVTGRAFWLPYEKREVTAAKQEKSNASVRDLHRQIGETSQATG